MELPPVYPVTDKDLARRNDHFSLLKDLVDGGASFVQIRDKNTPADELLADLRKCAEFSAKKNVTLIINDRCDLALSCGAAGVHLGETDLPPGAARVLLGETAIIGYSTHSLPQVRSALSLPVQYIGFGPVFATRTKKSPDPAVGLGKLRTACRTATLPVVAIGGIDLTNIRNVLESGARSAAIVSALMSARRIARRMEEFMDAAMVK